MRSSILKPEEFRFEKINDDERLSGPIRCALQDKQGFIWFGTSDGIAKYDGYNFKYYDTTQNFSSRADLNISACLEDSNRNLWFGTNRGSLLEYDCNNDCMIKHELNLHEGLPEKISLVSSLCEDAEGYLWISVYGHGLYKFDKLSKTSCLINYNKNSDDGLKDRIGDLMVTRNDELIILMEQGIDILNLKNGSYENIFREESPSLGLYCLHKFKDDKYFIGSSFGLKILDLKSKELSDYDISAINGKAVVAMSIDINGKLWAALFKAGLACIELASGSEQFSSLSVVNPQNIFNKVYFLLNDNSHTLWIGTESQGIYRVDIFTKRFYHINKNYDELKDLESVRTLKTDRKNNIWINSWFDYLIKFDVQGQKFKKYELLDSNGNKVINILKGRLIFEDFKNNLWIGTSNEGLFRYDSNKDVIMKYNNLKERGHVVINTISEYYEEEKHYLLLGSNKPGVTCIDLKNEEVSEFTDIHKIESKLKDELISRLFLDSEKNLWIHLKNLGGLFRISICKSQSEYYPLNSGKHVNINDFYEDSLNNLWFCTSEGLFKLTKDDGSISVYTKDDGLPSNSVLSMIEDNRNNFWVVTNKAILKFDPSSKKFRTHDCKSRITNEMLMGSCCKDEKGLLYFGGSNGIDYFNPNEINENTYIPNIVITDFRINNKSVIPAAENTILSENINNAKEINLSYRENVFSFEFAALVFNNPKQNQYAYMMEGFDKNWTYCGTRRRATYTNLNPGEYIFRVKGSNNDGIWNDDGTSIKITITPPYWKTWWFKGLGFMSMAVAAGLSYKNRMDKLEKEKKDQEEFSRKLIESQENERKRIASELHDTIAHDILITQNKAAIGLKHIDEKEKVENTLKEISEISSATIKDVRNISYNLHPHQLARLGFTKTIKSIVHEVSNATEIDFNFESDMIDGHLTKESEINLFRVIQESINNMIKHSGADKAEVKLLKTKDYILVALKDNGKGFNPDKKEQPDTKGGFGLSGIKERIKYMKGEIQIESEENKGTSINIRIPVKQSDM